MFKSRGEQLRFFFFNDETAIHEKENGLYFLTGDHFIIKTILTTFPEI